MHKIKELVINFDWSLKSIIKSSVAIVIVVVSLAIVLVVVSSVSRGVFGYSVGGGNYNNNGGFIGNFMKDMDSSMGFAESANSRSLLPQSEGIMAKEMNLSESTRLMPVPFNEGGKDSEKYERRNYNVNYETRKLKETCAAISDLKPLEYVVFDNSNKSEDWCNYSFRVEVKYEDDIIAKLKSLKPRNFDINTNTIERSIEYSDRELVILTRRLESTTSTLKQAEKAFNNLIYSATQKGDTATLSEVINNKISTIDRLTQQVLNTQERIDSLTKSRGDQAEQIQYANFSVSVSRYTFFDSKKLADEWKIKVQQLVFKVNATLLALTVGLISFILAAIELVVFAVISVIGTVLFAKVMWTVIKRIWKWQPRRPHIKSQSDREL